MPRIFFCMRCCIITTHVLRKHNTNWLLHKGNNARVILQMRTKNGT